ncbi:MAG: class I SAM-dependent methyltransferase [Pseudomonadota bacterium]
MNNWSIRLLQTLADVPRLTPTDAFGKLADLAFEAGEDEGNSFLDSHPECLEHYPMLNELYYRHVVANETEEVARILSMASRPGLTFKELAGEKGLIAYERNADMFNQVDFSRCETFVMVGCGQLPVTAFHVLDRSSARNVVCLDISEKAIEMTEKLKAALGLDRLRTQLSGGQDYDFGDASIIYIANMVHPKLSVVMQALRTSAPGARLIVREPYSLGRLWTERVEPQWGTGVEVTGKGPVSRHLSRDVYLQKPGAAGFIGAAT